MTHLSGKPKPASGPVSGWIQPIVIVLFVGAPEPELVVLVPDAPLMPELQASRRLPPPTTAAPTPAARNRLRRETPPAGGWLAALAFFAVWSVMVWISPLFPSPPLFR